MVNDNSKKMKLLWQQIGNETVTDILSSIGNFDGVVLDLEHGVFNRETIYNCIQIINAKNNKSMKSFVRVKTLENSLLGMILDAGVDGIILSTIESVDQAKEFIDKCNYPRNGGRRGQGLVKENFWGEIPINFSKKPLLIPQIENAKGVASLPKIKNMFPYFLIGPYDLSASLFSSRGENLAGDFGSKEYKEMIMKIEHILPKEKIGYHIVNDIGNQYDKYKDYEFLAFSLDTRMIIEGIKRIGDIICR